MDFIVKNHQGKPEVFIDAIYFQIVIQMRTEAFGYDPQHPPCPGLLLGKLRQAVR